MRSTLCFIFFATPRRRSPITENAPWGGTRQYQKKGKDALEEFPVPIHGHEVTGIYHPPIKRSVEIAGHKTSVSLEPVFWDMLKTATEREGVPLNALVARIDRERLDSETPPGLASALRSWLVAQTASGQMYGIRA